MIIVISQFTIMVSKHRGKGYDRSIQLSHSPWFKLVSESSNIKLNYNPAPSVPTLTVVLKLRRGYGFYVPGSLLSH